MAARTNAILDIYTAMVMAVLLLGCVRTKQDARKKSIRFIWIVLTSIVYVLSKAVIFITVYHEHLEHGSMRWFFWGYRTAQCVSSISYYVLFSLMVFYVVDQIREKVWVPGWLAKSTIPAAVFGAVGWCISNFTNIYGTLDSTGFTHGKYYWVGQLSGDYILILLILIILRYRKTLGRWRVVCFSLFIVLPIAAGLLRQIFPSVDYMSMALAFSVITIRNLVDIERAKTLNLQEARLREDRVRLMLSQIRPHFLYNTLNTIYVLCEQNPADAQRAIEEFSEFLRVNIGSLESDRLVTFDMEMKLVRHYLYLEQMRYQEDLRVEISLNAENFSLPPLTVQPLVENAVKHGLAKAPGGGTVRICSYELPEEFVIEVADNGVGFSPDEFWAAEKESPSFLETGERPMHIGLRSVRERLRDICGGTLEVESAPGKGTVAKVRLPKE